MAGKTHFIDGQWIEGVGEPFKSNDPATGEVTWEGRAAIPAEIDRAVKAAAGTFEAWADLRQSERVEYLEAFGELLKANKNRLAEEICRETGKPRWDALGEVDSMFNKIEISIEAYNDRCRNIFHDIDGASTATRFKAHGLVAVLGPFNFPGHLPNGHIIPALLAGNTVVFKPSGQAPLVGQTMIELWEAAAIPPGVVNLVQGRRDTGKALYTHPELAGLFFTGSAETGKALHKAFGGHPEKILALEMGGNNPLIVHEISDFTAAAYLAVLSAYLSSGQRCSCARRLIVPVGKNGDDFIQRLVDMVGTIRVGLYTDDPEPFMGPVISAQAAKALLAAQESLATQGGKILAEMKPLKGIPALLAPGLMDVTEVKNRPDEEYFGPFLQLIRVQDFDAAIREANNTSFGLTAGLISDSPKLYDKFYRKIRAGVVNWNRQTTGASSRMPFGGVGASGNHRPSAYFAADYCSYPVASIEAKKLEIPSTVVPGISL